MTSVPKPYVFTPVKLDHMSPADAKNYQMKAEDISLAEKYSLEVEGFQNSVVKPEDVFRRFSLNGDGKVDLKEFQLAMRRLGIQTTTARVNELYRELYPCQGNKIDINVFCGVLSYWGLLLMSKTNSRMNQIQCHESPLDANNSEKKPTTSQIMLNRALKKVIEERKKLHDFFLQMDVASTGLISCEEFELAMSYIGISLRRDEYDMLYSTFPSHVLQENENQNMIEYDAFFHTLSEKDDKYTTTQPGQRVWDLLVLSVDRLENFLESFLKNGQETVSSEVFRNSISRSGIHLSNQDFSCLLLKLRQFSDDGGNIKIKQVLHELSKNNPISTTLSQRYPSPRKRGKKKIMTDYDLDLSCTAAGKTSEQRRAQVERRILKSNELPKDNNFGNEYLKHDNDDNSLKNTTLMYTLEERIVQRMEEFFHSGDYSSFQSFFPTDRFQRINRGFFRQSLVHLGVIPRPGEVERLFLELDPKVSGWIFSKDLFQRFLNIKNQQDKKFRFKKPPALDIETPQQSIRANQKIIDHMDVHIPGLIKNCEKLDPGRTGLVCKSDFIWALKETGILLSSNDANKLVSRLSKRCDGVINYLKLSNQVEDLTSPLLSPKKSRPNKHFSSASMIMQQNPTAESSESFPDEMVKNVNQTFSSSIDLSFPSESELKEKNKKQNHHAQFNDYQNQHHHHHPIFKENKMDNIQCIIQNLLENRSTLRVLFNQMSLPENKNQITHETLIELLCSSRLNLKITKYQAETLISILIPKEIQTIGYMDLEKFLLSYQPKKSTELVVEETKILKPCESMKPDPNDASLRVKMRQSSNRLVDLDTVNGIKTAGVILRHAMRSYSHGNSIGSGNYDAYCRCSELKNVCQRLGIELNTNETTYIQSQVDPEHMGIIHSDKLLNFFIHLMK